MKPVRRSCGRGLGELIENLLGDIVTGDLLRDLLGETGSDTCSETGSATSGFCSPKASCVALIEINSGETDSIESDMEARG